MSDTPDRDPCEELGRIGPPPHVDRLRADLWRRLQRRLRRRRWWRQGALVAALAACYVAGFGTARLAPEAAPEPRPTAAGGLKQLKIPLHSLPLPASPLEREWQALDSPEQRPEAYREAGDRYVAEDADYQSAVRCYRQALDAGSDSDLAVAPDDNWLLMALKDARQKEKRYAKSND
jgi:hypothetical protein